MDESDVATWRPEHPDAMTYRRTAEVFRSKDYSALRELFDPDVVWHIPGKSAVSRDWSGFDDILRFFATMDDLTGGTFTTREHDVLASDDHVVALSHMGGMRNGETRFFDVVNVFHYRNGRQAERWWHIADQPGWDEFFAC